MYLADEGGRPREPLDERRAGAAEVEVEVEEVRVRWTGAVEAEVDGTFLRGVEMTCWEAVELLACEGASEARLLRGGMGAVDVLP